VNLLSDFAVEQLARPTSGPQNAIAVVDGERSVTYDELDRAADQVANGLKARGLGNGGRVAFVGRNGLACVELMLGAARAATVMTIVNWRLHPLELSYVIGDCEPGLIVTTGEFAPTLADLPEAAGVTVLVVDGRGPDDWEGWRSSQSSEPTEVAGYDHDDVVLQLYTSGTTGRPKGAMLTRRSIAACIPDTVSVWELDPSSVVLSVLPMFHVAGAGTIVGTLWARARLVIDNDPGAENMLQVIGQERVTNLVLATVLLQMLVEATKNASADLSSIRTISYGAAPITGQVLEAAIDSFGCRILQAYGLTETLGVLCVLDPADHAFDPNGPSDAVARSIARLRSCGRARPGVELRVVDIQTGKGVPAGGIGEVHARTARLMKGYWKRPEDTAEVLLADGWFRTGDVGELDADGYLFLRDRLKDTIISGGENIYPAEVEDALQWHPDVAEVAVIGVPDEKWGESPRAVVVRTADSSVTGGDLIHFARSRLAGYKCPTAVDFVDALPRNATGKVLRRELREPYWNGHARRIN
jgi:acyl-CoA synthetase (AMP-forming)/AMP-acid ligase II